MFHFYLLSLLIFIVLYFFSLDVNTFRPAQGKLSNFTASWGFVYFKNRGEKKKKGGEDT